jgi:large subunit ribosomal protein L1
MDVAKLLQRLKLVKIFKLIKLVLYMQELVKFLLAEQIVDNAHEIIQTLIKLKPTAAKGYIKKSPYKHYESCYCIRPKSSIIGS